MWETRSSPATRCCEHWINFQQCRSWGETPLPPRLKSTASHMCYPSLAMKINFWVVVSNIFIFIPIWGRFPFWLIFFRWVETTNQILLEDAFPFGALSLFSGGKLLVSFALVFFFFLRWKKTGRSWIIGYIVLLCVFVYPLSVKLKDSLESISGFQSPMVLIF